MSRLGCSEMSSCNFMLISPYKCHDRRRLESEKTCPDTAETTQPPTVTSNHRNYTHLQHITRMWCVGKMRPRPVTFIIYNLQHRPSINSLWVESGLLSEKMVMCIFINICRRVLFSVVCKEGDFQSKSHVAALAVSGCSQTLPEYEFAGKQNFIFVR